MFLVGDCHGKYKQYKTLLRDKPNSVCVGDMGVGFRHTYGPQEGEFYTNPPHAFMKAGNHRFMRGNHDNPGVCRNHSQWVPDGTVESVGLGKIFFCGGAFSIDRAHRTEGYNWWSDEELTYDQADKALGVYLETKPDVVVTHDAPLEVVSHIHSSHHRYDSSFTQRYLQNMWEQHQPLVWVFGHHHVSWCEKFDNTVFQCLNELEVKEI